MILIGYSTRINKTLHTLNVYIFHLCDDVICSVLSDNSLTVKEEEDTPWFIRFTSKADSTGTINLASIF